MIKIVPYEKEHAGVMYDWYYDPRYRNAFRTSNLLLKRADFENLEQLTNCTLAMIVDTGAAAQEVIGFVRATMRTGTTAVVGIMVSEEHQEQGKALAAMKAGIAFLKERGIHKIVARVRATDGRLLTILEKFGFVKGHIDPEEFLENDKWVDEIELYYR